MTQDPGLSRGYADTNQMLRQVSAQIAGRQGLTGTQEAQVAGVMQHVYDIMARLDTNLSRNNKNSEDEFNRIQRTPAALASVPPSLAHVFATPVTSGEEARERLAGISPEQMRAMQMYQMQALRDSHQTFTEDLNWKVARGAPGTVTAAQIARAQLPGAAGVAGVTDLATNMASAAQATARHATLTESLTDVMRKLYEGGGLGRAAGALASGNVSGALGQLGEAAPLVSGALGAGMGAFSLAGAIDTRRAVNLQAAQALSLGAGMDSNALAQQAAQQLSVQGAIGSAAGMAVNAFGLGPLLQASGLGGVLKGPDNTAANLRDTIKSNAVRSGYSQGEGFQTAAQIVAAGVSGPQDIANATQVAMAAATRTGLGTDVTSQMVGRFMTQGGMNPEHALEQFEDLTNAAVQSGVGVAKLASELTQLEQSGAGVTMNMAGLAAVQKQVGQGINAGQMLSPALTATGTQAIQYAGLLGFKSTTDFVNAQVHPQIMMQHVENWVQQHKGSFQGPQGQAALEAVLPQLGIDLSGIAVDKQANFMDQLIKGQLTPQQLQREYQTINTSVNAQRDKVGDTWIQAAASLKKQETGLPQEAANWLPQIADDIIGAIKSKLGIGGGGTTAAAAAHDAATAAAAHAQTHGAHLAHPPAHPGSAATAGAQTPVQETMLNLNLQGTLQVHDVHGHAVGTATIAQQRVRVDPTRQPKGHQPSPVGVAHA